MDGPYSEGHTAVCPGEQFPVCALWPPSTASAWDGSSPTTCVNHQFQEDSFKALMMQMPTARKTNRQRGTVPRKNQARLAAIWLRSVSKHGDNLTTTSWTSCTKHKQVQVRAKLSSVNAPQRGKTEYSSHNLPPTESEYEQGLILQSTTAEGANLSSPHTLPWGITHRWCCWLSFHYIHINWLHTLHAWKLNTPPTKNGRLAHAAQPFISN